jgi:cytochrome P450
LLQYAERLEERILSMIAQRRADPVPRPDVLSLLIRARDDESRGMTDAELVGQATILFGASYETTASSLTWTLFLLEQHPQVLADLVDELTSVLRGEPPTAEQLERLPLLERVVKEAMRVLPPVPFTIRSATAPTQLGGYFMPKGSRVICSHFMTHHLPELYPEPEHFRPARWETIDPGPYEYLPFSAGPRMCIGVPFAMQAIRIAVAMIFQRFRLELVADSRVDRAVRVTMSPRRGMPATIRSQDRRFAATRVRGNVHDMVALPHA